MNFNIDEGSYDYDFDAPSCANFDDVIVDYVDWFKNLNEIETETMENIERNSEGIQRPSTYKKNNGENIEDDNLKEVVCENPMINMKNKKVNLLAKMKQFNVLEENDENENPLISLNDKKKQPGKFKKVGDVVSKGIFHLKQTMTVCKPKEQAPREGMNRINKTACKSNRNFGPLQTLNKKAPTRAVAPSFMAKKMNNNSAALVGGKYAAPRPAAAAVSLAPGALGMVVNKKTVPMAPNLATSQRANMKKEKFQQMTQNATAIRTMTIDRQLGQTKPPILAKPPFYKCATVARCGIDSKPINLIGRIKPEEPKDKVVQDKATPRQLCNANTASTTRSNKVTKNLPHWNC